MGLCGSSLLKGIRFGPMELLRTSVSTHVVATSGRVRGIPERTLSDILNGKRVDVTVSSAGFERGSLPPHELISLLSVLVANRPAAVLEIGTFMGATTRAIAQNLPEAVVHTVDLPLDCRSADPLANHNVPASDVALIEKRQPGREFADSPYAARIKQHFCDTAKWDFTEAQGATCFFIDGAHSYEYCKNDSEKCFELCKGRGVFLWHDCDYFSPGVIKFVREWRRMGRDVVRIAQTPIGYLNTLTA